MKIKPIAGTDLIGDWYLKFNEVLELLDPGAPKIHKGAASKTLGRLTHKEQQLLNALIDLVNEYNAN